MHKAAWLTYRLFVKVHTFDELGFNENLTVEGQSQPFFLTGSGSKHFRFFLALSFVVGKADFRLYLPQIRVLLVLFVFFSYFLFFG